MIRVIIVSFLFSTLLFSGGAMAAKEGDANDDQYTFLGELYDLTSGEMWKNNSNWLVRNDQTTLCNWYGITCSGKWVQKISLSGNGLGGPLPDKWERLPYLESLDLSSNKILGSIPSSIGNLTLTNLLLNHNSFRGTIPNTFGKLGTRLLYLDNNQLTGTLPANIANNPLVGLTLDLNKLTGTVANEFGKIGAQFMVISAAFNDFTGTLPSGICQANACNFEYNAHLGCPSQSCTKCMIPACNCGKVCYTASDCAGGSCPGCSKGPWGYTTCGGK